MLYTFNQTVEGMIDSGCSKPLGYVPAGSTNDFANSLELPKDMGKSAHIAVEGNPFVCDVGRFNESTFIYVAAFGLFSAVSYQTPQEQKNILGHLAYIIEGAKQLRDIPAFRMQVEYDGQMYYGFGANTDIIAASVEAYIDCINKFKILVYRLG